MSFTATFFPIIAALAAPEGSYFKLNNRWQALNDKQQTFIEQFFDKKSELSHFNDKELRSWVSEDAEYLNKIARENGFSIQLKPFKQDEFGSLSILDVAVQWKQEGAVTSVENGGTTYKATELKDNFSVFQPADNVNSIIKIPTQTDDIVYISVADEPLQEFALLHKISNLQTYVAASNMQMLCRPEQDEFGLVRYVMDVPKSHLDVSYTSIIFPHVKLDQEVDISWLLEMRCPHILEYMPAWRVAQALQQTKFAMDEKGAHVESAVAVSFMLECCGPLIDKQLVIDKSFYLWIERPGCSMPVFAAYIDPNDWVRA